MLHLTPRTFTTLEIELGEPAVTEREGLLIPATVNGVMVELAMARPEHLACKPHLIQINGVTYDMSWWATRGGSPHLRPTPGGWRDRSLRLQRDGSSAIRAYTTAAFRLAAKLMDTIADTVAADTVAADTALLRRAEIVKAEREIAAAHRRYNRALQELDEAEGALIAAEFELERLAPVEPWPALPASMLLPIPAVTR